MTALERSPFFSQYKSMEIFPDTQEQLTNKSLVGSCQILNPSKMLWVSLLPLTKKNQSKMKELEWSQGFPNYNPIGVIYFSLCKTGDHWGGAIFSPRAII